MSADLLITIRFLQGRYHGTGSWPPEPARLFQALVAGAAMGPRLSCAARTALLWLERLDPPIIAAPPARRAHPLKLWVPNNDADASLRKTNGDYGMALAKVRTAKMEQPWLFDSAEPVHYLWSLPDDVTVPEAMGDVTLALYRLGRGVDMAFAEMAVKNDGEALLDSYRGAVYQPGAGSGDRIAVPCQGTLTSLERRHATFIGRFEKIEGGMAFRQPPKPRLRRVGYNALPQRLIYHLRRTGEKAGSFYPWPLTRASTLIELLLAQVAERLKTALPGSVSLVDRQFLGIGAGEGDKPARIHVLPVPSSGNDKVDPSIRRVVVEVPANCSLSVDDLDWAFSTLDFCDPVSGELADWRLERAIGSDPVFRHFTTSTHQWRSVTPLVLPFVGRQRSGTERRAAIEVEAASVRAALRHARIRVEPTVLRVQREPFRRQGARADNFVLPDRLDRLRLAHVSLRFAEPVKGPLILGDGRYRGLGLFEPVVECTKLFPFRLDGSGSLDVRALALAARRAVMARVRDRLGDRNLPAFFTGHDTNGAPLRSGGRRHVGFLVDPERRHLLIATPQALDHRSATDEESKHTRMLAGALAGFDRLVAGAAGAFRIAPETGAEIPLISPALLWESVTDWIPNRHGKGDPAEWIASDIARDCVRRGLPRPQAVEPLVLRTGSRGGTRARLRLRFTVAVSGPVALGRTSMQGGGVFVGRG